MQDPFAPKKFWGEVHPKGTPGLTQNSAENVIFVKFGRNFCMCRMGHPTPKIFGLRQVMTLIYFHVEYLWINPKTHWDTPFQSLTTFERFFVGAKKSLFSIPLRNPLRTGIFQKYLSKINPFFLWGGQTQTKAQNLEAWPQSIAPENLGSVSAPQRHIWDQICGFSRNFDQNPHSSDPWNDQNSASIPVFFVRGSDPNQGSKHRGRTWKHRARKFGVGRCTPKAHMRPNLRVQPKFRPKSP